MGENGLRDVNGQATEEDEARVQQVSVKSQRANRVRTHKKGAQVKFSKKAPKRLRCPRRYSRRENEMLPDNGNTNMQASQISKLWKYQPSTSMANPSKK